LRYRGRVAANASRANAPLQSDTKPNHATPWVILQVDLADPVSSSSTSEAPAIRQPAPAVSEAERLGAFEAWQDLGTGVEGHAPAQTAVGFQAHAHFAMRAVHEDGHDPAAVPKLIQQRVGQASTPPKIRIAS
jgi:hypothetical protein